MKTITVISYKFGEKSWKNFEGEPIKKYEHSVLLDISNTDHFICSLYSFICQTQQL